MNDIDILKVFLDYYTHILGQTLFMCMDLCEGKPVEVIYKCSMITFFIWYFAVPFITLSAGAMLVSHQLSKPQPEPEPEPEDQPEYLLEDDLIVNNMSDFEPIRYSDAEEALFEKAGRFNAPRWALDACRMFMMRPKLTLTRGVDGTSDRFDVQGHNYDEKMMQVIRVRYSSRCLATTRQIVGEIDNTPLQKAILDWIKMRLFEWKVQNFEFFQKVDVRLSRRFSWMTSQISGERMNNPCMALHNGQWVSIDESEANDQGLPYVMNDNLKDAIEYFLSLEVGSSLTLSFSG